MGLASLLSLFLLMDASNGFALTPGSPLSGAGTPTGAPTTDYCGNPRPAGHPSIGAFDIYSGSNCQNLSLPPLMPPMIIENTTGN